MNKIRLLDTFSGIGGFHLALRQSIGEENVDCIGFSEIDKFAKQVYTERFPNSKDLGSITEIEAGELEDFDLLTGGFPCQSFSVCGKQGGFKDLRGQLVYYLLDILKIKQPKYFIFENVKGFLGKKFREERDLIFKTFEDLGYNFQYKVLNTKDFGLPQNRQRVFMVGIRNDIVNDFTFPQGEELTIALKNVLDKEVDEKYYMINEQYNKQYNKLSFERLKRIYTDIAPTLDTMQGGHRQPKIKVSYPTRSREFLATGFKDICPTLCARDCKDPKQVLEQVGNNINTPRINLKDPSFSSFNQDNVFIGKDGIVPTLTRGDGGVRPKMYDFDEKVIRKLTEMECEKLQGFPIGWSSNIVSRSQSYKQMGNAISIPVVKAIFNSLFKGYT